MARHTRVRLAVGLSPRMAVDPRIVEALTRLKPGAPPTEAQYVARDADVLGRGWNMMARAETVLLAGQPLRALVHGCTGVGKSTELARWRAGLAGRVDVVYLRCDQAWALPAELGRAVAAMLPGHRPPVGPYDGDDVRDVIAAITARTGRPVLVIVDGTDLVGDPASWFGPRGEAADRRLPPMVLTAPHAWCLQAGPGDRDEAIDAVWHLPPFPVVNDDGSPNEPVIEYLAAGLARRLDQLDILESPDLLRRIARQSAGVPRFAITLLRQAVLAAAEGTVVRAAHVLEAEREVRQDLRQGIGPDVLSAAQRRPDLAPVSLHVSGAVLSYEGPTHRFFALHPLLAPT